jgi:hypothetical protein
MSKSVVFLTLTIILLSGLFVSSCKKNENTYQNYNITIAATKDYVIGQHMMVLILNTYFKSITDSLLLATGRSDIDGAAVYLKGWDPDTLLIRYPYWGAEDGYGHWRSGDIKVCAEQGFLNTASVNHFSFINFMYDKDTLRVDSLFVHYLGSNGAQGDLFDVSSGVIRQIFSDASGTNTFWMKQLFVRYKDATSPFHTSYDLFEISGLFEGEAREGVNYTTEIMADTAAVLNQFDCPFLKQGPVNMAFRDLPVRGLVYFSASDTCANQYVAEFDGNPFPAPIYERKW